MNFLAWLNSLDPRTNWLAIRDRDGLVGIEREVAQIVEETGGLHLKAVYDAFFLNGDPWSEEKVTGSTEETE